METRDENGNKKSHPRLTVIPAVDTSLYGDGTCRIQSKDLPPTAGGVEAPTTAFSSHTDGGSAEQLAQPDGADGPGSLRQSYLISWLYEILWIIASITTFIVIVVVLYLFDDRPLPNLPLNITLNTFVAFFSTLSKASFMIAITEAISQCKWNWFRHDHPLADFETFDAASRSFWGSVALLGRVRWRNIASLGALVTIVSVVTSPITQQVISYPTRIAPSTSLGNASVSAVQAWGYDLVGDRGAMVKVISAVFNSFMAEIDHPVQPLPPSCPSAECTFPSFHTLGLCYQVADITDHLNVTEEQADPASWPIPLLMVNATRQYNISLGVNCSIVTPSSMMFRTCSSHPNISFAFQDDAALMAAKVYSLPLMYARTLPDTFANISDPGPVTFEAIEVLFHLCVQKLETAVVSGQPQTRVTHTSWQPPQNHSVNVLGPLGIDCDELSFTQQNTACTTPDSENKTRDHRNWLAVEDPEHPGAVGPASSYFRATRGALDYTASPIHEASLLYYVYDPTDNSDNGYIVGAANLQLSEALFNNNNSDLRSSLPLSRDVQMQRLDAIFSNVATGVTNLMRSSVPWTFPDGSPVNSYNLTGTVLINESYVHVRWGWMAFMVVEIALAALFLALTVLYTARFETRILKSSPLATLLALDSECRSAVLDHGGGGDARRQDTYSPRGPSVPVSPISPVSQGMSAQQPGMPRSPRRAMSLANVREQTRTVRAKLDGQQMVAAGPVRDSGSDPLEGRETTVEDDEQKGIVVKVTRVLSFEKTG